jgi:hypothetical protein
MQLDFNENAPQPARNPQPAWEVPVPGLNGPVGLGAAISGLLSGLFGVQPCGGCKARAEALDQRVGLKPWDA